MPSTLFFIPNTSPLFTYTPSNSWLGAYRPDGHGWDQTFHTTSSGDAIVGINITASSIKFQSSAPSSSSAASSSNDQCHAQYRVNGSEWSDACLPSSNKYLRTDLPSGIHLVEVRGKDGSGVEFMGIQGELPIYNAGRLLEIESDGGDSAVNQTIDDNSPSFRFTNPDQWTSLSSSSGSSNGDYVNFTLKTMYEEAGLSGFYGGSLSGTTVQGASVDLTFQGEAVYVYGLSGPNCGSAQVMLDGQLQHDIDMRNDWETHGSLLYMSGGFDPNDTHTLHIINNEQGEQLIIDYALVTVPHEEKKSHIPLIAGISGGLSFLILLLGLCWLIIVRRNKRKEQQLRQDRYKAQYAFANGIGKDGIHSAKSSGRPNSSLLSPLTPASGQSSFVATQGEYVWGTGRPAGLDLAITTNRSPNPNPNTNANTPDPTKTPYSGGLNTATWNTAMGLPRSPPPDYPDYIPYQAPPADTLTGTSSTTGTSGKSAYRPVAPRSSTAPNPMPNTATYATSSSPSPLLRSATSASASNTNGAMWLQNTTRIASPTMKSKSPLLGRMNSLTLLSAKAKGDTNSNKPEYDDIALDSYNHNYQKPTPITPPPIPAEYGDYTPTTGQGHNHPLNPIYSPYTKSPSTMMTASPQTSIGVQRTATRSSIMSNIARYFPAREAVSSLYRAKSAGAESTLNLFNAGADAFASTSTEAEALRDGARNIHNLPTATTIETNFNFTPKTPKTAIGNTNMTPRTPDSGGPLESSTSLTRGLSVKTIDTVKSWLPDFIFATSTSTSTFARANQTLSSLPSVPSTPNIPQAARPDSGIFPLALNNGPMRSIPLHNRDGSISRGGTPTSSQLMPSTATRSFFGNTPYTTSSSSNSPSSAKTLNASTPDTGRYMTPAPTPSGTGSSGHSYGYAGANAGAGTARGMEGNEMFIELNPNSPIGLGDSRPGSELTHVGRLY
ncbi:uncharacterized protein I303_102040 [Kwoniella dejecticola CBS 10117]|uniref:Uncharacterized protein n=1 Tax=Kwoniella dejecticola CBS 10117 TaxID=1296121 RepID=A0A1A6AC47_9TREE|nr:uncharacterized protein I303_01821 [Kwoniella dejecticola CBS 10117]OBR87613.1 hypothetical protein I303_01821 [Kwoniella dejecticola CBS 10117]